MAEAGKEIPEVPSPLNLWMNVPWDSVRCFACFHPDQMHCYSNACSLMEGAELVLILAAESFLSSYDACCTLGTGIIASQKGAFQSINQSNHCKRYLKSTTSPLVSSQLLLMHRVLALFTRTFWKTSMRTSMILVGKLHFEFAHSLTEQSSWQIEICSSCFQTQWLHNPEGRDRRYHGVLCMPQWQAWGSP